MFSKKSAKLLKESTGEHSYGSTTDSSVTEAKAKNESHNPICQSAPEILEPSKDTPRPLKTHNQKTIDDSNSPPINLWRTLVTCSCPEPSTTVLIRSSGDCSNDHADEEQTIEEQQVYERHSTCYVLIHDYKNAAIRLRNSSVLFQRKCIDFTMLPAYSGLTGVIGIAFTCLWLTIKCHNRQQRFVYDRIKTTLVVTFLFFSLFLIPEICIFGLMSSNFNQEDSNYYDKTFYFYELYKLIAIGVYALLALLLYLPGCSHYHCNIFSSSTSRQQL